MEVMIPGKIVSDLLGRLQREDSSGMNSTTM